jgi:hypothetical protein
MKRLAFTLAVAGAAIAGAGCASQQQPQIELTSSDFDLNPLVGEWRGNYSSSETGRSGVIAFTLRAGEASASGNVVMIPRADSSAASQAAVDASTPAGRQVLTIHFVRKEGSNVVGTLDPYNDPECACLVRTTFQGTFSDRGAIEGTYTTVPSKPGTSVSTGRWRVTRVKKL